MPRLQATVMTTTTEEVSLTTKQRTRLLTGLRKFATLKQDLDAIQAKMDAEKETVTEVLEEVGQEKLTIEGFHGTIVSPVRGKFDKKQFVKLGGDLDVLAAATKKVPGKPYTKITVPGEKVVSYGDDE